MEDVITFLADLSAAAKTASGDMMTLKNTSGGAMSSSSAPGGSPGGDSWGGKGGPAFGKTTVSPSGPSGDLILELLSLRGRR